MAQTPKLTDPQNNEAVAPVNVNAPKIQADDAALKLADMISQGVNKGFEKVNNFSQMYHALAIKKEAKANEDLAWRYNDAIAKGMNEAAYGGKHFANVEELIRAVDNRFNNEVSSLYSADFINKWKASNVGLKTQSVGRNEMMGFFMKKEYADFLTDADEKANYYANLAASANATFADSEKSFDDYLQKTTLLNPADRKKVLFKMKRLYQLAQIEKDVRNNPDEAIENLKRTEYMDALTPVEKDKVIEFAKKHKAAVQGTINETMSKAYADLFMTLKEGLPASKMNPEYKKLFGFKNDKDFDAQYKTPYKVIEQLTNHQKFINSKYAMDYKTIKATATMLKGAYDDPDSVDYINRSRALAQTELDIKELGIEVSKDGKGKYSTETLIANVAKNPLELTTIIAGLENSIDNGNYGGKLSGEANKALINAYNVLGNSIVDSAPAKTKASSPAYESAKTRIVNALMPTLVNDEPALLISENEKKEESQTPSRIRIRAKYLKGKKKEPEFSDKNEARTQATYYTAYSVNLANVDAVDDIGNIYVASVKKAVAHGLNLNSNDAQTKADFNKIVDDMINQRLADKYGIPYDNLPKVVKSRQSITHSAAQNKPVAPGENFISLRNFVYEKDADGIEYARQYDKQGRLVYSFESSTIK